MNYKNILATIFLAICVAGITANETSEQIEALSKQLREKEENLKEIVKKITEQEEVISQILKKLQDLFEKNREKHRRFEMLENQECKVNEISFVDIFDRPKREINKSITQETFEFIGSFGEKIEKEGNSGAILLDAFCKDFKDTLGSSYALAKYYAIRYLFENINLKLLLAEYEVLINECFAICASKL